MGISLHTKRSSLTEKSIFSFFFLINFIEVIFTTEDVKRFIAEAKEFNELIAKLAGLKTATTIPLHPIPFRPRSLNSKYLALRSKLSTLYHLEPIDDVLNYILLKENWFMYIDKATRKYFKEYLNIPNAF